MRWSAASDGLLLSKLQAQALDILGVPHPPLMIPITEEQRSFWRDFGRSVEFLPEEDLEDLDLLKGLSEEWTAAATISEAIRRQSAESTGPVTVWILGPGGLEYHQGFEQLEQQLWRLLGGARALGLRLIFQGPEVPAEIHGRKVWLDEGLSCEHWRGYWHEHEMKSEEETPQLFVALNAGTSVTEYRHHWSETLRKLPASAVVYITGFTLAEAQDAQNDITRIHPAARCEVAVCCSGTLQGLEFVELGKTPSDFPGKANYAICVAIL